MFPDELNLKTAETKENSAHYTVYVHKGQKI